MKCDRRWWNDGRHEQECADAPAWELPGPPQLGSSWGELDAKLDDMWRRLMEGDPDGQPWHEVLAAWAPSPSDKASVFFGVNPRED